MIRHLDISELPPATRAWMESRPPDRPRQRNLPWLALFFLAVFAVTGIAQLVSDLRRGFARWDDWMPALIVVTPIAVPCAWFGLRAWRRNRMEHDGGQPLGFHFSPTETLWHDEPGRVWTIPVGCVKFLYLASYVHKSGISPDSVKIYGIEDEAVAVPFPDYDPLALWLALRARHPEAQATHGALDREYLKEIEAASGQTGEATERAPQPDRKA